MSRTPASEELSDDLLEAILGTGEVKLRELADEPELASEVARLKRTFDLVGSAAETAPPAELRERILRAAQARPAKARKGFARVVAWRHLSALAASLLALVLGVDAYRTRGELALERELNTALQQPNVVQSFSLVGTGAASGAFGNVALDLDAKKGALVLKRLPQLPEGKVYRLWAIVGGATVPCGDFRVAANGSGLAQFAVPVESYTAPLERLIVTVESPTGGTVPTGPTVMETI